MVILRAGVNFNEEKLQDAVVPPQSLGLDCSIGLNNLALTDGRLTSYQETGWVERNDSIMA